jgi:hypothetical protein
MSFLVLPGQKVVLKLGVTTLLFGDNLTPAYAKSRSIKNCKFCNKCGDWLHYIGVCTKGG